jgi:hypothetical protein
LESLHLLIGAIWEDSFYSVLFLFRLNNVNGIGGGGMKSASQN